MNASVPTLYRLVHGLGDTVLESRILAVDLQAP
jgi:hypothetical protein